MVSSREVIKKITAAGWEFVNAVGDHHHYKNADGVKTTIPHPTRDLSIGVLVSVEKVTGIRLRPAPAKKKAKEAEEKPDEGGEEEPP